MEKNPTKEKQMTSQEETFTTPSPLPPASLESSAERPHEQNALMWSPAAENEKNQRVIGQVLEDHGYSLDSVLCAGKVSTIWLGQFRLASRKVPLSEEMGRFFAHTASTKKNFAERESSDSGKENEEKTESTTAVEAATAEGATAAAATATTKTMKTVTTTVTTSTAATMAGEASASKSLDEETVAASSATSSVASSVEADASSASPSSSSFLVAIKVSTECTAAARLFLRREMEIWRSLEHPHIVPVFEVFDLRKGCCIAMEATQSGDLLDHVHRNGFLPEAEGKRIFAQIVSAVDYLHERDIAHRDLKCDNVLSFGDGRYKLTDLGFSRSCRDLANGSKVMSETFCGSVPYAAPEVLEGRPYNPIFSDVWSLGVMLYVILYGSLPLSDENVLDLLNKAKNQDIFFPDDPDVSHRAVDLMLAMMEPEVLSRTTVREIQRSSWICKDDESSSDSSISPPSIIIQGKLHRRDSFLSDLVNDEFESRDGGCACCEAEAAGETNTAATASKLPGEFVGDGAKDWISFEWMRDRQSSSSSNESAKHLP